MNKVFFAMLLLLFSFGIANAQNSITLKKAQALNEKAPELRGIFLKASILEGVSEMSNFELAKDEETGDYFVAGQGKEKNGNDIVFRAKVTVTTTTTSLRIDFGIVLQAESCAGVNCSLCAFAKKGGCECKRTGHTGDTGFGHCNHVISK